MAGREGKHNRVSLLRTMYFPPKRERRGKRGGETTKKRIIPENEL